MDNNVVQRLKEYYTKCGPIQKYIRGLDKYTFEVIVGNNVTKKNISIDDLEKIKDESEMITFLNGQENVIATPIVKPVEATPVVEVAPVAPAMPSMPQVPVAPEQTMLTAKEDLSKETLNDVKILSELKNKNGLDNLLKKFAINPSTGLLDINMAINKVLENTKKAVLQSINDGSEFELDLSKFDIEGNYIGTPITSSRTNDEKIVSSFNNVKIYLDAAKMYPEQITVTEDLVNAKMKEYIDSVSAMVNQKMDEPVVVTAPASDPATVSPMPTPLQPIGLSKTPNKSAGFADIFVLTIIVLVYAVIIVNLIMKLA